MTRQDRTHACVEERGARVCYELRTYGHSPVLRHASDHSEGAYMAVDEDGACDCWCHEFDDDEAAA